MTPDAARTLLHDMFMAAVAAADPGRALAQFLPDRPQGRCIVVGAGKSAAAMARAVEVAWPDVDLSGVVITRYGHSVPTTHVTVREAAHPVPDAAGAAATREVMEVAARAGDGDLVLALISGGGSALMTLPHPDLTLADKITVNRLLLRSGLAIEDMNKIRRRLSQVKGGGLAQAVGAGARLVTLAISDVPGDDPAAIASGPTVPDPSAAEDLSPLVQRLGPDLPAAARDILLGAPPEKPHFDYDYRLIATPQMALEAAAEVARAAGITPLLLGDALEGEAATVGIVMAGIARAAARHGTPAAAPVVLLSGGETTVTVRDHAGRGGRNTEFLLSCAIALDGAANIYALAADTDGIDGTEDAAGAIICPDVLQKAAALGLDPKTSLAQHDSYSIFDATGDLIRTGPTLTNVNDFRALLILP
ncbi:glycerate kinase type-2 family protein [Ketogulonicigenium vulgare]|uniref:Hydroxypyruvate reductase protein n=1 Tax=Ketogulonicigenium vulgare (strain WSH-001) TaxID=759362 RepID=F9Y6H7_KETVW|nr:glycerate kinase [Ketogulonicigenium vulgare]ADO42737.1 hydroxypyruvate reductase [Ketogulonicigenium vulgare Y25]AEM40923.1 Hydroxypyruvate reductase protein [Ketogulonicigenium vulgare WSH-001]ALJ81078.1 hydroxypyruvate reductase [Ketogulonicigenium vulgare]ANW33833.1 hydroxypyruvate reductase [Ketogulonicigenium vulgare]AOZ54648.1 hydroxypyruvate reductase [Ketogulonicigenium vulgare]